MKRTYEETYVVNFIALRLKLNRPQAQVILYAFSDLTVCHHSAKILTNLTDGQVRNQRLIQDPVQLGFLKRVGSYYSGDQRGRPTEIFSVPKDRRAELQALIDRAHAELDRACTLLQELREIHAGAVD